MKHAFALILLLLVAQLARALDQSPHCRIRVADGSTGSGTLFSVLEDVGYIATCSHLFDDSQGRIVCSFPDGQRFAGILRTRDTTHDIAIIKIRKPQGIEPTGIGEIGSALTVCGYGPEGRFRSATAPIDGNALYGDSVHPCLTVATWVRPGDSGGAALDDQGRLVGVVWGTRDGQTYIAAGDPFWKLVEPAQCYGGVCHPHSVPTRPRPPTYPPVTTRPPQPQPPAAKPCDCGPKWDALAKLDIEAKLSLIAKLEARITQLETNIATLQQSNDNLFAAVNKLQQDQAVTIDNRIEQYFEEHQTPAQPAPLIEDIVAAVIPKLPPQRVEWERLDGVKLTQEKPLGEWLKFKSEVVGVK